MAPERQQPGGLSAFKAVFSALFGIRKGSASQDDLASLRPWQIVTAGVIGAVLFVAASVTLVRFIASR